MKHIIDLIKEAEKRNECKKCPAFSLYNYGPYCEDNRNEIPAKKGVYFAFEFDKEQAEKGMLYFKRLIYVGKATEDNTLRKRISDHYTQHDLKFRETKELVDMDTIAFYYCVMENDDEISDVEAAQIFKQQPPANTIGIDHYVGEQAPLMIHLSNDFKLVDKDLYKSTIIIRTEDKE